MFLILSTPVAQRPRSRGVKLGTGALCEICPGVRKEPGGHKSANSWDPAGAGDTAEGFPCIVLRFKRGKFTLQAWCRGTGWLRWGHDALREQPQSSPIRCPPPGPPKLSHGRTAMAQPGEKPPAAPLQRGSHQPAIPHPIALGEINTARGLKTLWGFPARAPVSAMQRVELMQKEVCLVKTRMDGSKGEIRCPASPRGGGWLPGPPKWG